MVHPVDEQNEGPVRAIKGADLPTMLEVEILSSKSKVSTIVDGATVSKFICKLMMFIQLLRSIFFGDQL